MHFISSENFLNLDLMLLVCDYVRARDLLNEFP